MRVLIVNKFLYQNGGAETYVFETGRQLESLGHEVEYFGMEHKNRIVGNRAGSYTSNMDFHTGKLAKLLYPMKIIYSVEARRKIRRVLDDFLPDVVHLNNFNFQITPSIIYEIRKYEKQVKRKVKIIFTAHDYQLVCPNHLLLRPLSRELCKKCLGGRPGFCSKYRCIHGSRIKSLLGSLEGYLYQSLHTYRMLDRIICPSRFMQEQLSSSPDLREKTVVMHNFADRVSECSGDKESYVLYFGRYCKEKGIKTLLDVCRQLPQIPFVFAGSGPLESLVNQVENIENRGFLTGEELLNTIARAKFTVFPSEWYENCPFSVMETQMYGTPVIASDLGGTPELVEDKVTGELFTGGDKDMLREKIQGLWEDEEKLARYTEACGEVHFDSSESYCRKLVRLYME